VKQRRPTGNLLPPHKYTNNLFSTWPSYRVLFPVHSLTFSQMHPLHNLGWEDDLEWWIWKKWLWSILKLHPGVCTEQLLSAEPTSWPRFKHGTSKWRRNTNHPIPLLPTYLLTNYMKQSPSWEAKSHSASQEILQFYGTLRFITAFTTARYWSLSWVRWIQSTPSNFISLRSILILSYIYA
jgi:hypothetical protein